MREGGKWIVDHCSDMTDPMLRSGWETPSSLNLTQDQMAFLADLRKGSCRATAGQDAGVIGPLIRANLVRWEDDPSQGAGRGKHLGSSFVLTSLGEACLADHEARSPMVG